MERVDREISNYRKGGIMRTTNKYWIYLEKLRRTGLVNMFGASAYLENDFDLSHSEAVMILADWMKNYKREDYEDD